MRDSVLVVLTVNVFTFWMYFLGFIVARVSYLLTLGFSIEETIFPEMVANLAQLPIAVVVAVVMPKIDTWHACTFGHLLFAVSFAFWGPYTVVFGHTGPYFGAICSSSAFVILEPAVATIISLRVEEENQGKCQAAVKAVGTIGAILGILFYNVVLFSATSRGMGRATPAIFSMMLALLCAANSARMSGTATAAEPPTEPVDVHDLGSVRQDARELGLEGWDL